MGIAELKPRQLYLFIEGEQSETSVHVDIIAVCTDEAKLVIPSDLYYSSPIRMY
jgi:hypothetical protein